MLRLLVNATICVISLGCIGFFLFLAPAPPVFSALDRAGAPLTLTKDGTELTAFFERERDKLRLIVLFDDPLEEGPNRHKASIRLADSQSFSLVLGREEGGLRGQRYTFSRSGSSVNIRVEDLQPYAPLLTGFGLFGRPDEGGDDETG